MLRDDFRDDFHESIKSGPRSPQQVSQAIASTGSLDAQLARNCNLVMQLANEIALYWQPEKEHTNHLLTFLLREVLAQY